MQKKLDVEQLISAIEADPTLTQSELSRMFNVSRERIRQVIAKHKIPWAPNGNQLRRKAELFTLASRIKELISKYPNYTRQEIADHLLITVNSVKDALKISKIKTDPWESSKHLNEIINYIRANPHALQKEIAQALGLSQTGVSRIINANKVPYIRKSTRPY